MKKSKTSEKLVQKVKWVLVSSIAINTLLVASALADTPKTPKFLGE